MGGGSSLVRASPCKKASWPILVAVGHGVASSGSSSIATTSVCASTLRTLLGSLPWNKE